MTGLCESAHSLRTREQHLRDFDSGEGYPSWGMDRSLAAKVERPSTSLWARPPTSSPASKSDVVPSLWVGYGSPALPAANALTSGGSTLDVAAVVGFVGRTIVELIVIWGVGIVRREPA